MDIVVGDSRLGDVFQMCAYIRILLLPKHTHTLMTTDKLLPTKCATGTCPVMILCNTEYVLTLYYCSKYVYRRLL
jgi:hypothetical protein